MTLGSGASDTIPTPVSLKGERRAPSLSGGRLGWGWQILGFNLLGVLNLSLGGMTRSSASGLRLGTPLACENPGPDISLDDIMGADLLVSPHQPQGSVGIPTGFGVNA